MNDMQSPSDSLSDLPIEIRLQIEKICQQFEQALRGNQSPRIENVLEKHSEISRSHLLRELLSLEMEHFANAGKTLPVSEYHRRFPKETNLCDQIVSAIDQSNGNSERDTVLNSTDNSIEFPEIANSNSSELSVTADDSPSIRYLGEYELIREIHRGGMGVVFLARQRSLGRIVAVKLILSGVLASEQDVERFRTEAQATAKLDHPGIVPIFEIGEHKGLHYYSMAYVEGPNLNQLVSDRPLDPKQACRIMQKVADATQYAHDRQVIHRDIKPANILMADDEEPRVTDFGLAKRLDENQSLSGTGQVLGTPGYMSPEQAAGLSRKVGPTSDVYSLGATLYALITGRAPFQAASVWETIQQVQEKIPVSPCELNPAIDKDLETICLHCLEKEPSRRYSSAKELSEDLGRYLRGEPIQARPISLRGRFWRWCKRNPVVASLTATTFSLTFLTAIISIVAYVKTSRAYIKVSEANDQSARALEQSRANFRKARQTVDELLSVVADEEWKEIHGVQPLRRKLAEKAVSRYEELASEQPENSDIQAGLGKAYASSATIIGQTGEFKDALEQFQHAESILAEQVRKYPSMKFDRYELALCRYEIGVLFWMNSRNEEAHPWILQAYEDIQKLLRSDPENATYHFLAAKITNSLGNTSRQLEDPMNALTWYKQSRRHWEFLRKKEGKNPKYLNGLAAPVHNIALVLKDQKEYQEALKFIKNSEELDRQALKYGGYSPRFRSDLSIAYINKASVLRQLGKLKEARQAYEQSIVEAREVHKRNPQVHRYRSTLAYNLSKAASYRLKKDNAEDERILASLKEAVQLYQDLTKRDSTNPRFAEELLEAYTSLHYFHLSLKQPSAAIAALNKGIAYGERVINSHHFQDDPQFCHALAELYSQQADLATKTFPMIAKNDREALRWYDKTIALFQKRILTKPKHVVFQYHLNRFLQNLTSAYEAASRLKQELRAQDYLIKSFPWKEQAKRRDSIQLIAYSYRKRGEWFRKQNQLNEAIRFWKTGIAISEKEYEKYPWHFYLRSNLATSYKNLAEVAEKQQNWREEIIARRKWLKLWGGPMQSMQTKGYVEVTNPVTRAEAERLRRHMAKSPKMKKFTIPCDFAGVTAPFDVYITETPPDVDPLGDQARWLWEERGGVIPEDVRESFRKLRKLAAKNNVSFQDLCVYALKQTNTNKK
ncbi:MAG: hypothetical protein Tsb009_07300 [Planctomycetaceae bacterium]